jgi:hypothetical protein
VNKKQISFLRPAAIPEECVGGHDEGEEGKVGGDIVVAFEDNDEEINPAAAHSSEDPSSSPAVCSLLDRPSSFKLQKHSKMPTESAVTYGFELRSVGPKLRKTGKLGRGTPPLAPLRAPVNLNLFRNQIFWCFRVTTDVHSKLG